MVPCRAHDFFGRSVAYRFGGCYRWLVIGKRSATSLEMLSQSDPLSLVEESDN